MEIFTCCRKVDWQWECWAFAMMRPACWWPSSTNWTTADWIRSTGRPPTRCYRCSIRSSRDCWPMRKTKERPTTKKRNNTKTTIHRHRMMKNWNWKSSKFHHHHHRRRTNAKIGVWCVPIPSGWPATTLSIPTGYFWALWILYNRWPDPCTNSRERWWHNSHSEGPPCWSTISNRRRTAANSNDKRERIDAAVSICSSPFPCPCPNSFNKLT